MTTSRRNFLIGLGAAAVTVPSFAAAAGTNIPVPTPSPRRKETSPSIAIENPQIDWVLDALSKKHGGNENIPPTILVDKANGLARAYARGQELFSFKVITGKSGKDEIDPNASVFKQKVTPAGNFDEINVVYDPSLKPENYNRQMAIIYTPIERSELSGSEVLAFHSVLNKPEEDGGDTQLSSGCIRVGYEDFDKLLKFSLGEEGAFINRMAEEARKDHGRRLWVQDRPSLQVLVLPQEDQSKENTLRTMGLSPEEVKPGLYQRFIAPIFN